MKALLLTDLLVYGLLLISSYFLVFRRSPRLAPAPVVGGEVKRDPVVEREEHVVLIGEHANGGRPDSVKGVPRAQLGDKLGSERDGAVFCHGLPELQPAHVPPLTLRPWWAAGLCVETSP